MFCVCKSSILEEYDKHNHTKLHFDSFRKIGLPHSLLARNATMTKTTNFKKKTFGVYRTCVEERRAEALAPWKNGRRRPEGCDENMRKGTKKKRKIENNLHGTLQLTKASLLVLVSHSDMRNLKFSSAMFGGSEEINLLNSCEHAEEHCRVSVWRVPQSDKTETKAVSLMCRNTK